MYLSYRCLKRGTYICAQAWIFFTFQINNSTYTKYISRKLGYRDIKNEVPPHYPNTYKAIYSISKLINDIVFS